MTQQTQRCEHCGASMKIWEFKLTPALVDMLRRFSLAIKSKGINDVHYAKEIHQENTQYTNFHKLRYWGLIARVKKNRKVVRGHFLLTHRGSQFLRGEIEIPKRISMWRNKIYSRSEETTHVVDYFPPMKEEYYQTEFNYSIHDYEQ